MSELYERFREVRNSYKGGMTQEDFAKILGIGQSTLAMMEVGKRNIADRHIKLICATCGISENWLRTGKGSMYHTIDEDIVDGLVKKYDLNANQEKVIRIFLELPENKREAIANAFFSIYDAAHQQAEDEIQNKVDSYETELRAEKNGDASLSQTGNADTKNTEKQA